jgi:regulator of sigma E protease
MLNFIGLGNGLINIVLLLVILVVLVVIHEFGHFAVARWAGVRVHEFGIGFPPRARVLGSDGETTYTLNWLPIGGFVRMEGEEGESEDPRSFVRQRLPVRLVILLAGVTMNLLLALVIFTFIALLADPVADVRVAYVEPNSPAASIGLQGGQQTGTDAQGNPKYDNSGDVIVAIDGQRFPWFDHINSATAPELAYLHDHEGQTVTLTVENAAGQTRDATVTLRSGPIAEQQGALGIHVAPDLVQSNITHDPITAVQLGVKRTVDAALLIFQGLQSLVSNFSNPQVAGPVGIVSTVGQIRQDLPPIFLLWFVGLLSANLAVVNALPLPPLDGGRVAVSLIQAVIGNRFSAAAERLVYLTGFFLLMLLLVWITFNDLQRLVS